MADTKDTATRELTEPQKAWVAALRSGKYKQGREVLRSLRSNEFCCLGVACDIAVEADVIPAPMETGTAYSYGITGDSSTATLPHKVMGWLGVRDCWGIYTGGNLVSQNDSGKTFAQIADLIESRPEGLFFEASS